MMDEQKVIQKVLNGDTDVYGELVSRYQTGLIIHCEHILNQRQDAEDVAQEAFIRAFNRLAMFNAGQARFSTWLYRIATNAAIDYLRRTKKRVHVEDIEAIADATMPAYLEEDEKRALRKAILQLEPPKYGQIIKAYYWYGKSYDDLAREYATNTNTIGTWMRRAKAQLRKELSL